MIGAGSRNRTHDQRFTKPLLYQLSYAGTEREGRPAAILRLADVWAGSVACCQRPVDRVETTVAVWSLPRAIPPGRKVP